MKSNLFEAPRFETQAMPTTASGSISRPLLMTALGIGLLTSACSQNSYQLITVLDGALGEGALIEGSDGKLYGTTAAGGGRGEGMVFKLNKDGSSFSALYSFVGILSGGSDGSTPQGLLEGKDGALYGTTQHGGQAGGVLDEFGMFAAGNGTVFRLNKDGSGYRVLRRLACGGGEGSYPWAGLAEGPDGALYGTTLHCCKGTNEFGSGTVFRLNRDGSGYRVLHTFGLQEEDGDRPFAALLIGTDGILYGTTDAGGKADARNGIVFKLNPDGSGYAVLHSFPQRRGDGRMPRTRLVEGRDAALYGTTSSGGHKDHGTVFKLNKDGSGYRLLHSFSGQDDQPNWPEGWLEERPAGKPVDWDGAGPQGLVQARDGALYGTTGNVGKNGQGTAFKLNPDGSGFTILHAFPGFEGDGKNPHGTLIAATDGAVYGMTENNSTNNCATLFRLAVAGGAKATPVR